MLRSRAAAAVGVIATVLTLAAPAAGQNPVTWSASSKAAKVEPSGTFTLEAVAKMDEGWHLYSISQPPPPIATKITLAAGQPFVLAGPIEGPKPRVVFDQNFGINTELYDGAASFRVPVKAAEDAPAGSHLVKLQARFQACTDQLCLPPRTVAFEVGIEVSGSKSAPAGKSAQTDKSVPTGKSAQTDKSVPTDKSSPTAKSAPTAESAPTANSAPTAASSPTPSTPIGGRSLWSFI